MSLDARHHLFYQESSPSRIWRVTNSEDKEFILKLYEVTEGTNAVDSGYYMESVYVDDDNEDFNRNAPESGTEWAYVETSIESFLKNYREVTELPKEE